MSGARSRRKGHSYERELAQRFRAVGFPEARRKLEYHAGDALGYDVQGVEPFYPQAKCKRAYVSVNTINEVKCDRAFGDIPLLFSKADAKADVVVMYADDFFDLLARLKLARIV